MAASMGRVFGKNSLAVIQDVGLLVKHQASPLYNVTPVMYMRKKHYNPKFRKDRMYKIAYFDKKKLYNKEMEKEPFTPRYKDWEDDKKKEFDKKRHDRNFQPRAETEFSSHAQDPWIPPEGDGKHSILNSQGIKEAIAKKRKRYYDSIKAARKIRRNGEETFKAKDVVPELMHIYIEAHKQLTNFQKNKTSILDLVTDSCYSSMLYNMQRLTIKWDFVENIEPPKVVNVACMDGKIVDVYYAQVTLRIHSKQVPPEIPFQHHSPEPGQSVNETETNTVLADIEQLPDYTKILAMYDQFGRLIYGDTKNPRDVLDFIIFEKNIVDIYGKWRMKEKLVQKWQPTTHKLPTFYEYASVPEDSEKTKSKGKS